MPVDKTAVYANHAICTMATTDYCSGNYIVSPIICILQSSFDEAKHKANQTVNGLN